jgi:PKHD-type hydroxylase
MYDTRTCVSTTTPEEEKTLRELHRLWRGKEGFESADLDRVAEIAATTQSTKATLGARKEENDKARRSRIAWLSENLWLKDRLWGFAEEANRRAFAFDVTRCCDVQYTEYHADEKGHYDWHVDVAFSHDVPYDRKISLTVQLSDPSEYEGGSFGIHNQSLPDWHREKGTVLVFPSYMLHRVEPVTKGVRRSLVAWFEGPRWR